MTINTLLMIFAAVSSSHQLPPHLLASMCFVESRHDVHAINRKDGAGSSFGVCQVKAKTCSLVGIKGDLMDPQVNIQCAATYLHKQIKRYNGNIPRAVTAYNKGHSSGSGRSAYFNKVLTVWRLQ